MPSENFSRIAHVYTVMLQSVWKLVSMVQQFVCVLPYLQQHLEDRTWSLQSESQYQILK